MTATVTRTALAEQIADQLADGLATPPPVGGGLPGWWPQSLAHGGAGITLLHIERAATGRADGDRVRAWLRFITSRDVSVGSNASLYFGAPAVEFVLHAAAPLLPVLAETALPTLQRATDQVIRRCLDDVWRRLQRNGRPPLAEFDGIRGLAGLGALLLCRAHPAATPLGDVLDYLVALTEPILDGQDPLPGWWTDLAPSGKPSREFPGGHANSGMAHGIASVLAVLALARRRGITVDGHTDAIVRILAWLDRWRRENAAGAWWPYWITRAELRAGRAVEDVPRRPSWCYGTLGVARAQQLAGIALGDPARQAAAEAAAAAALADPAQLRWIDDVSLCHGYAGLLHLAGLIAADSSSPGTFTEATEHLLNALTRRFAEQSGPPANSPDPGWLEGRAGTALALHALAVPPATGWDRALLAI